MMQSPAARFDPVWYSLCFSLLLVMATVLHIQITLWSDHVGFSSNREFYYSVLHPVRTMIRNSLFFAGLVGVSVSFFILARRSRRSFVQGLLVMAGACVSIVLMLLLLHVVPAIFAVRRGDADLEDILHILLQTVPHLLAIAAITMVLPQIGREAGRLRWFVGITLIAAGLHGLWLLGLFTPGIVVCLTTLAVVLFCGFTVAK